MEPKKNPTLSLGQDLLDRGLRDIDLLNEIMNRKQSGQAISPEEMAMIPDLIRSGKETMAAYAEDDNVYGDAFMRGLVRRPAAEITETAGGLLNMIPGLGGVADKVLDSSDRQRFRMTLPDLAPTGAPGEEYVEMAGNVIPTIAALLASAHTGGQSAMWALGSLYGAQGFGAGHERIRRYYEEQGEEAPTAAMVTSGTMYAAAEMVPEMLGFKILSTIGGKAMSRGFAKMSKDITKRNATFLEEAAAGWKTLMLGAGLEEGTEEAITSMVQNWTDQYLMQIDPDGSLMDGTWDAFSAGFLMGPLVGPAAGYARATKARKMSERVAKYIGQPGAKTSQGRLTMDTPEGPVTMKLRPVLGSDGGFVDDMYDWAAYKEDGSVYAESKDGGTHFSVLMQDLFDHKINTEDTFNKTIRKITPESIDELKREYEDSGLSHALVQLLDPDHAPMWASNIDGAVELMQLSLAKKKKDADIAKNNGLLESNYPEDSAETSVASTDEGAAVAAEELLQQEGADGAAMEEAPVDGDPIFGNTTVEEVREWQRVLKERARKRVSNDIGAEMRELEEGEEASAWDFEKYENPQTWKKDESGRRTVELDLIEGMRTKVQLVPVKDIQAEIDALEAKDQLTAADHQALSQMRNEIAGNKNGYTVRVGGKSVGVGVFKNQGEAIEGFNSWMHFRPDQYKFSQSRAVTPEEKKRLRTVGREASAIINDVAPYLPEAVDDYVNDAALALIQGTTGVKAREPRNKTEASKVTVAPGTIVGAPVQLRDGQVDYVPVPALAVRGDKVKIRLTSKIRSGENKGKNRTKWVSLSEAPVYTTAMRKRLISAMKSTMGKDRFSMATENLAPTLQYFPEVGEAISYSRAYNEVVHAVRDTELRMGEEYNRPESGEHARIDSIADTVVAAIEAGEIVVEEEGVLVEGSAPSPVNQGDDLLPGGSAFGSRLVQKKPITISPAQVDREWRAKSATPLKPATEVKPVDPDRAKLTFDDGGKLLLAEAASKRDQALARVYERARMEVINLRNKASDKYTELTAADAKKIIRLEKLLRSPAENDSAIDERERPVWEALLEAERGNRSYVNEFLIHRELGDLESRTVRSEQSLEDDPDATVNDVLRAKNEMEEVRNEVAMELAEERGAFRAGVELIDLTQEVLEDARLDADSIISTEDMRGEDIRTRGMAAESQFDGQGTDKVAARKNRRKLAYFRGLRGLASAMGMNVDVRTEQGRDLLLRTFLSIGGILHESDFRLVDAELLESMKSRLRYAKRQYIKDIEAINSDPNMRPSDRRFQREAVESRYKAAQRKLLFMEGQHERHNAFVAATQANEANEVPTRIMYSLSPIENEHAASSAAELGNLINKLGRTAFGRKQWDDADFRSDFYKKIVNKGRLNELTKADRIAVLAELESMSSKPAAPRTESGFFRAQYAGAEVKNFLGRSGASLQAEMEGLWERMRTASKHFLAWFGGSRAGSVVGDRVVPQPYYTVSDGNGAIYATTSKEAAGENAKEVFIKTSTPLDLTSLESFVELKELAEYLASAGIHVQSIPDEAVIAPHPIMKALEILGVMDQISAAHDGIMLKEGDGVAGVVVFSPNQIAVNEVVEKAAKEPVADEQKAAAAEKVSTPFDRNQDRVMRIASALQGVFWPLRDVNMVIVPTVSDLPTRIVKVLSQDALDAGIPSLWAGNTLYYVAEEAHKLLDTDNAIVANFLHEFIVHGKLKGVLEAAGIDPDTWLDKVWKENYEHEVFQSTIKEYLHVYGDTQQGRRMVAEEFVAHIIEEMYGPKTGTRIADELIEILTGSLKSVGLNTEVTPDDIAGTLRSAIVTAYSRNGVEIKREDVKVAGQDNNEDEDKSLSKVKDPELAKDMLDQSTGILLSSSDPDLHAVGATLFDLQSGEYGNVDARTGQYRPLTIAPMYSFVPDYLAPDGFPKKRIFRGRDGHMRAEIDATKSEMLVHPNALWVIGSNHRLGDIMKYDELFQILPHLQELKVVGSGKTKGIAAWVPSLREIWINPNRVTEYIKYRGADTFGMESMTHVQMNIVDVVDRVTRAGLLHEIQHVIQDENGWARGGASSITSAIRVLDANPGNALPIARHLLSNYREKITLPGSVAALLALSTQSLERGSSLMDLAAQEYAMEIISSRKKVGSLALSEDDKYMLGVAGSAAYELMHGEIESNMAMDRALKNVSEPVHINPAFLSDGKRLIHDDDILVQYSISGMKDGAWDVALTAKSILKDYYNGDRATRRRIWNNLKNNSRINKVRRHLFTSIDREMRSVADRIQKTNPEASAVISEILNSLNAAAGTEVNGPTFLDIRDMKIADFNFRLEGIVKKLGYTAKNINPFKKADNENEFPELSKAMEALRIGPEAVENLQGQTKETALEIRQLLDDLWDYMVRNNAIDNEHKLDNYVPRILSQEKIDKVGLDVFIARIAEGLRERNPDAEDWVIERVASVYAESVMFGEETGLKEELRNGTAVPFFETDGGLDDRSPFFLRERKLNIDDKYLADFTVNDPVEVLTKYIYRAVNHAELTDRLGRDMGQDKIAQLRRYAIEDNRSEDRERQALREQGFDLKYGHQRAKPLTQEEVTRLEKMLFAYQGRLGSMPRSKGARLLTTSVQNYTALTSLGLVTLAALAEFTAPIITMGFKHGGRGMLKVPSLIAQLKRGEGFDQEIAKKVGAALDSTVEHMLQEFVFNSGPSAQQSRIMAAFFRWNGLQAITRLQRTVAVTGARAYIEELLSKKHVSVAEEKRLGFLGLPKDSQARARLLDYVKKVEASQGDELSRLIDLNPDGPNKQYAALASQYRTAIMRMARTTIVHASTASKPLWMSSRNPILRLAGQLSTFTMAFREGPIAMWQDDLMNTPGSGWDDKLGILMRLIPLLAMQYVVTELRRYVTYGTSEDGREILSRITADETELEKIKRAFLDANVIGSGARLFHALESAKYGGNAITYGAGPWATKLTDLTDAIYDGMYKGDFSSFGKLGARSVPFVGQFAGFRSYGDSIGEAISFDDEE